METSTRERHLHRPHHTNVPIRSTAKRPKQQRLPKRRRESESQAGYARPQQTNEQNRFASHAFRIGNAAPHHGREELRGREAGVQDARLAGDGGIGKRRVEPFKLVKHVGLFR